MDSQNHRTERALNTFLWTYKILLSTYVRAGRAFVRIRRVDESENLEILGMENVRYIEHESNGASSKCIFIMLCSVKDDRSYEIPIDLPSASSNIPKWVVPEIGVTGFGKTFYFGSERSHKRHEMEKQLSVLHAKINRKYNHSSKIDELKNVIEELKNLTKNLTDQLHLVRLELLETKQERDMYLSEREYFLSELKVLRKRKKQINLV